MNGPRLVREERDLKRVAARIGKSLKEDYERFAYDTKVRRAKNLREDLVWLKTEERRLEADTMEMLDKLRSMQRRCLAAISRWDSVWQKGDGT